ncbi:murein L,D-transpeptidase catalytic domain family protein [Halomonas sp. ANAO-440]|uniref:murein L,D-transpeptidase catalytic domain family protein n=1 Tax=Halomonas sp. ANAO-440 TaxID=2861360 RepID=UPI001CAA5416|nr:murein L,D-transpeptidase catalytic domain family protein [Halomonas sp. ANAO-440]MBZ0330781.1 murein L,D-transpeptidase catalytic domain family protein [Halomonas sp. ANAO-440]
MTRHPTLSRLSCTALATLLFAAPVAQAGGFLAQALLADPQYEAPLGFTLTRLAPDADPHVLRLAASALACAEPNAERLAVIDFSRPSTEPRLWVFDLAESRLLFEELVSHGQGTGDAMAEVFSNVYGSHQSSLGLFRTMNSYYGRNGYSLRLEGLEEGINDLAYQRAIVIHGADYVSEAFIEKTGRLGRSQGCPAVRQEITYPLIDSIKEDQYLFAYYPDSEWLESSAFLACQNDSQQLAMN